MKTKLEQQKPIFWKGKLCKLVKWETMNLGGKLEVKINKSLIEVDIDELTN
jgi:hypothetical protein